MADAAGLHVNTINKYLNGSYEPRMSNLIILVTVIANEEERSPTQLMFEAITSMEEMKMVEQRWRKKIKRSPDADHAWASVVILVLGKLNPADHLCQQVPSALCTTAE